MPDHAPDLLACFPLLAAWPLLWGIGFQQGQEFERRRRADPEPETFTPSMAWNLETLPLIPAFPVGVGRKAEPEKPYSVGRDERIIDPLLSLLLNEYGGGERIPRTGVPLTWRTCRKYGMKRAGWQALTEYVFPGRGYLAPGPGGKLVTVLAAARAREFVKRARKAGRVGTPPLNGAVSLDLGDAT